MKLTLRAFSPASLGIHRGNLTFERKSSVHSAAKALESDYSTAVHASLFGCWSRALHWQHTHSGALCRRQLILLLGKSPEVKKESGLPHKCSKVSGQQSEDMSSARHHRSSQNENKVMQWRDKRDGAYSLNQPTKKVCTRHGLTARLPAFPVLHRRIRLQ